MSVPVPDGQPGAWHWLGESTAVNEGNRPWSAGAGAGALATRLAQGAWMLPPAPADLGARAGGDDAIRRLA